VVALLVGLGVWGCGESSEAQAPKPPAGPFAVSDYFTPSVEFADPADPKALTIEKGIGCKERPAGARGACYRVTYRSAPHGVALWQYPAGNAGEKPGLPFPPNLTRIRFQVAIGSTWESVGSLTFGIGEFYQPFDLPYGDTLIDATLVEDLSETWQYVEMPVPSDDYPASLVQALGFDFAVAETKPDGIANTFYLDDIVYE
jgi:hypothetical protein